MWGVGCRRTSVVTESIRIIDTAERMLREVQDVFDAFGTQNFLHFLAEVAACPSGGHEEFLHLRGVVVCHTELLENKAS